MRRHATLLTLILLYALMPGVLYATSPRAEGRASSQPLANTSATELIYSTYLGGSNFDIANAVAVDSAGCAYIVGWTQSPDFPATTGAFQTSLNASNGCAFVTKLNSTGSSLVYSTFLGGSNVDSAYAVAVDSTGDAYVAGIACSFDFPTTTNAFQTILTSGSGNAFVTEMNPTGSSLVYSTFLGGSSGEQANGISIDSTGSAYVTGLTYSTDFPTTTGAFQTLLNSAYGNAFVTKFDPTGSVLTYSTFLGGSNSDWGCAIAVDSAGSAYASGVACSTDFPTTTGAFQTSLNGVGNAFVTKLNSLGSSLVYSTFLGGSGGDGANALAVDSADYAYVTGLTDSTDFPTTPSAFQGSLNGIENAFATKVGTDGSSLVYSTFLGGSNSDGANAVAIDASGQAYIAGWTQSTDFPTTSGAFQTSLNASEGGGFVTILNVTGSSLTYSTFLSGSGDDWANAIAVDSGNSMYIAGQASSSDFPTTSSAFQTSLNGSNGNAFVAKLNASACIVTPTAGTNGTISPNTPQMVTSGGSVTFTAMPNAGCTVGVWSVDGSAVQTGGTTFTLSNVTTSHTVSITFNSSTSYTVTPSAGANGTISPNTAQTVNSGGSVTFTATPSTGYTVATWSVDGSTVQTGGTSYTLSAVAASHTVSVAFKILTYTVTPSAGTNGTISPNTAQTANYGTNVTFTATPSTGYTVGIWSVDGSAVQTGGTSFTLSDVTASHTVSVTFTNITYTVTPSAGANGTISPNTPQTVASGGSVTFTATPSTGYTVATWSVDGSTVQTGGTSYTLSAVAASHTVSVAFKILTYTVTPSAGTNGTISPNSAQTANYGTNVTFTATPSTGYTVGVWSVDGSAVQTGGTSFTLSDVTASHTVSVTFTNITYTVTPSAGANGTISPNTPQTVASGGSVTFTATPSTGYTVATWSVDGSTVQTGGTSYTLSAVAASHTVSVAFKILTYTVTPSAGTNGTISPNTAQTANYGTNVTFTATPSTGYAVGTWFVDGSTVQAGGTTFTLSNVTANHAVSVTFTNITYTVTPSAGANGTISPNTAQTVASGGSVTFTAAPSTGYTVATWSVDGSTVQTGGTLFTLSSVNASHTVSVTFKTSTNYIVTPSAGTNGTISPNTPQTVASAGSVTFTAAPAAGYGVSEWAVDGSLVQTGGTSFTLSNVIASHTVSVTFKMLTYTVTPSAGVNGTISPNTPQTLSYGASINFTATPSNGYIVVGTWSVDGSVVQTGGTSFTLSNVTANHTVSVTFTSVTYTVTPSAGANGTISPNTAQTVSNDGSATFTATPNTGYAIATWTLNGKVAQTGGNTFTVSPVTINYSVQVTFAIPPLTIRESAGANGTMTPNTPQTVAYGGSMTFTATPNTGYVVGPWAVDGVTVRTGGASFTLSDITVNHSVQVWFISDMFTLTPSAGANGTISPSTVQTVTGGSSAIFTAMPSTGYAVSAWTLNGKVAQTGGDTFTVSPINANYSVQVSFAIPPLTIRMSAGANGTMTPNTPQTVAYGGSMTFAATPNTGYAVMAWTVDGATVQTGGTSFTLSNITANHSVQVWFKAAMFTVTPSAGANGTITPNTPQTVNLGGSISFTASPSIGYGVATWTLNGKVAQTGGNTFTIMSAQTNYSVQVTFTPITFMIRESAQVNGSISPNTPQTVSYGSNVSFTAVPNTGYTVLVWAVDGVNVQTAGTSFTLSNITANHSVQVWFSPVQFGVTPSATGNGTISPSTQQVVSYSGSVIFTATPSTGYAVSTWSVDGNVVQTGGTQYTLSDVTANTTVVVTFAPSGS